MALSVSVRIQTLDLISGVIVGDDALDGALLLTVDGAIVCCEDIDYIAMSDTRRDYVEVGIDKNGYPHIDCDMQEGCYREILPCEATYASLGKPKPPRFKYVDILNQLKELRGGPHWDAPEVLYECNVLEAQARALVPLIGSVPCSKH